MNIVKFIRQSIALKDALHNIPIGTLTPSTAPTNCWSFAKIFKSSYHLRLLGYSMTFRNDFIDPFWTDFCNLTPLEILTFRGHFKICIPDILIFKNFKDDFNSIIDGTIIAVVETSNAWILFWFSFNYRFVINLESLWKNNYSF